MTECNTAGGSRRRAWAVAALASLVAVTGLAAAPGADAKKKPKTVPVKVMTRNLFLGADLSPALNSTSAQGFIQANGEILREVDRTNFPLRAQGLAGEIASKKPDLVGLQEVAWWRTGTTPGSPHQSSSDPQSAFTATTTKYDFLQLLMDQLDAKGLDYEPAVVKEEFDFEAPTDYDGDPNNGVLGGEIQGRLTMRDVILVNKDSKVALKISHPQSGTYSNLYTPTISGITVPVTRGWTAADVKATKGKGKKKATAKFRFVNTHFEAFDDETQHPSIRALQAQELLDGPANAKRTIILGDFNSNVPGVKPGDEQAYQTLLDGGFDERTMDKPITCCFNDLFAPTNTLDHQVDHVMTNMGKAVKLVSSQATGTTQTNGLYDSDHAGVFSSLKVSK
jgi:endonuclease/exonuclease/phosphatase family metal-dependent hydrolase